MKKMMMYAAAIVVAINCMAQQKPATPANTVNAPIVKLVSTKEYKKQFESKVQRKKWKDVIRISDTLIKRKSFDKESRWKRIRAEIFLVKDKAAIADLKQQFKNKDSAATLIASIPGLMDFEKTKRKGEIYYKTALAMSPNNGVVKLFYGFQFADDKNYPKALEFANKGFALLNDSYKAQWVGNYSNVLYLCNEKEEAYKVLINAIENGNTNDDVIKNLFTFYAKDERFEDGIKTANNFLAKDTNDLILIRRGILYKKMGNAAKACEDAAIIARRSNDDYFQRYFECPSVMAPIQPTKNRTYIYEVEFQGKLYDFRVTNPVVDMNKGITFKYKMTGEVGINGVINISKEAIDTAHDQMNRFSNGNHDLVAETSVWVSNAVFNELKNNGEAYMNASIFSAQVFEVVEQDDPYYPVTVDGETKYVKCIKVVSKSRDDGQELWIVDDPKNPLILKMNLDFRIELKQVI